jgi:hypothetical protein
MNEKQRKVIFAVVGVIVLMAIFPPFQRFLSESNRHIGYHFITDIPPNSNVNVALLFAQIVVALVVGALIYYALATKK